MIIKAFTINTLFTGAHFNTTFSSKEVENGAALYVSLIYIVL